MAIGKGSLFSLKAQGRIGKDIVLRHSKGQTIASTHTKSAALPSAAQIAAQSNYQQACAAWRALPQVTRDWWAAQRPQLSTNKGFSNFVKDYITGEVPMNIGEELCFDISDLSTHTRFGDWAVITVAPWNHTTLWNNPTPSIGDYIEWKATLMPGDYRMIIKGSSGSNRGILALTVDGAWFEGFDEYSLSVQQGCYHSAATVTVAAKKEYTFRAAVSGKRPASTSYYVFLHALGVLRVA